MAWNNKAKTKAKFLENLGPGGTQQSLKQLNIIAHIHSC